MRLAASGNHFLKDEVFRRNEAGGFFEARRQLVTIVDAPGFGDGETVRLKANCRLENNGERAVEVREFLSRRDAPCPRLIDSKLLSEFMQLAFVACPLELFPRRNGYAVLLGEQVVIDGRQVDGEVVRRNQRPAFEAVLNAEVEKEVNFLCVVAGRPGNPASNISGGCGYEVAALFYHPNGNATAAQTAYDAEGAIVRSHEQSTEGAVGLLGNRRSGLYENRNGGGGGQDYL